MKQQSPEHDGAEVPGDLGPYRFDRRLGVGGMGEVFLAFDRRLDRHAPALRPGRRERTGTVAPRPGHGIGQPER